MILEARWPYNAYYVAKEFEKLRGTQHVHDTIIEDKHSAGRKGHVHWVMPTWAYENETRTIPTRIY
jgi:hypothetical protein